MYYLCSPDHPDLRLYRFYHGLAQIVIRGLCFQFIINAGFHFSVLIVVAICLLRQCGGKTEDKEPFDDDPDDDIRENIMYYDEEGAGRFFDQRTKVDKANIWLHDVMKSGRS